MKNIIMRVVEKIRATFFLNYFLFVGIDWKTKNFPV